MSDWLTISVDPYPGTSDMYYLVVLQLFHCVVIHTIVLRGCQFMAESVFNAVIDIPKNPYPVSNYMFFFSSEILTSIFAWTNIRAHCKNAGVLFSGCQSTTY